MNDSTQHNLMPMHSIYERILGVTLPLTVHHLRTSGQELKQGRDLEAGADAEAIEEC